MFYITFPIIRFREVKKLDSRSLPIEGQSFGITFCVFGYQVSGIRFRVAGFGYQGLDIRCQISDIRFRVSSFGYQVSGNAEP